MRLEMKYLQRFGWILLGIVIGGTLAVIYTDRPSKVDKTNARIISNWPTEQRFTFLENVYHVPFKEAKYITYGEDGKQKVNLDLGEADSLRLHHKFGALELYNPPPEGYKRKTYDLSEFSDYDDNFIYLKSKGAAHRDNKTPPERYLDGIFISKKPLLLGQRIVITCDITFLPSRCAMRPLHLGKGELFKTPIFRYVFPVRSPNREPCSLSKARFGHNRHWDYKPGCMHLHSLLEQLPQELEKMDEKFDDWRQNKVELE